MSPLHTVLLRLSNFRSPLLSAVVPGLSCAIALQAAFAIPSIAFQSERFYDLSGSVTYLAVTALSIYTPTLRAAALPSFTRLLTHNTLNWRQMFLVGAVSLWATRLGSYLFERVLREGHDSRFEKIRTSPMSFLGAFSAQAMWVTICLLPVLALNALPKRVFLPGLRVTDVLGVILWFGGFALEVAADRQKSAWLKGRREKTHDEEFMTKGLWSVVRYPNYLGEITLWTGIATLSSGFLLSSPTARAALQLGRVGSVAVGAVSPAFVAFLLLKVSGVPLSESKYDARFGNRKDYREWKEKTPMLIPRPW